MLCQCEEAKAARLTAAAVKTRFACPMAWQPAVPPTSSALSPVRAQVRQQGGCSGGNVKAGSVCALMSEFSYFEAASTGGKSVTSAHNPGCKV